MLCCIEICRLIVFDKRVCYRKLFHHTPLTPSLLHRPIDSISYKDVLYALFEPVCQYISDILRFLLWTPTTTKPKYGTVALDNPPDEPLLADVGAREHSPPLETPADEHKLAQYEAYLKEKKSRKAAKRFKKLLDSANNASSVSNANNTCTHNYKHLNGLNGPPTDVGSVDGSTWSGWSHSTCSPHEADSGSAFSLTQDDIADVKLHRQRYYSRQTKMQKMQEAHNTRDTQKTQS
ncbi:hypothetical protein E3P92_00090 [Wallemia ichthyophaga]|nr:hypothetical protein E3P92_00090 [Wallemia ichthyophaga]TIB37679.1 hypothetical protein E3P84_00092 [Wallemia ichthyophaga]TIB44678.1 hypothetical protein E3P83_00092 [Wallemia ichthyophaga]